jgi:hypothetical protein
MELEIATCETAPLIGQTQIFQLALKFRWISVWHPTAPEFSKETFLRRKAIEKQEG